MKKVLIISRTDIKPLINFKGVVDLLDMKDVEFDYLLCKPNDEDIIGIYDLVISVHSPYILSKHLVNNIRCINIHPGYNPYNRGWFPHVFAMIDKGKIGVTIHEMNDHVDDGFIICQKEIKIKSNDTSFEVYKKILEIEFSLVLAWLRRLIKGDYKLVVPGVGNYNSRLDFDRLCRLDLTHEGTFEDHLYILKALSFNGMKNAYFEKDGEQHYLELNFL